MPYLIRRLLHMVFVLWAIATVVFLMFRLMPGDPSTAFIDPTFTEDQQREIRAQFGLDRPLPEQYLVYLGNLLRGDDSARHAVRVLHCDVSRELREVGFVIEHEEVAAPAKTSSMAHRACSVVRSRPATSVERTSGQVWDMPSG